MATQIKPRPSVGPHKFPNWHEALRYAKQLKDAGQIGDQEYKAIETHALASNDDATAYANARRRG